MAYKQLIPVVKVKQGVFRIATVRRGKNSDFKLQLTIPSTIYTRAFGTAEFVNVYLGEGTDAGKLHIEATDSASPEAFKPTPLKNCFILLLQTEHTPQIELEFNDPVIRIRAGESLTIDLPDWAHVPGQWKEIQKARSLAKAERVVPASAAPTRKQILQDIGKF